MYITSSRLKQRPQRLYPYIGVCCKVTAGIGKGWLIRTAYIVWQIILQCDSEDRALFRNYNYIHKVYSFVVIIQNVSDNSQCIIHMINNTLLEHYVFIKLDLNSSKVVTVHDNLWKHIFIHVQLLKGCISFEFSHALSDDIQISIIWYLPRLYDPRMPMKSCFTNTSFVMCDL